MIDDPLKTMALMATMKDSLPIKVALTPQLQATLAARSPELSIPSHCEVVDVRDLGEEGGIVCTLDVGGPDAKTVHLVSLTHLRIDRRSPFFRIIDAYQRHRIKKLKRQNGRGF